MKQPVRLGLAALAAGILVSAAVLAGDPFHEGHGTMGDHGPMSRLGLSEEQKTQVHAVLRKHMDGDLGEQIRAFRAAHDALDDLVHDPSATERQVTDSANAAAALGVRVAVGRHKMMSEIAPLLTPEQIEKAREFHRGHHRRPHGPMGMDGF
jgi:Spy/CpxP family protein refolding chaperone